MTQEEVKIFKLYDQAIIVPIDIYSALEKFQFKVFSGSRILITVFVKQIDVGAVVNFNVLNSFTLDNQTMWDDILDFSIDYVGYKKQVLTDFNKFFQVNFEVTGGSAEFAVAISVFDNAMTTRIENAEIDVHVTHKDTSIRQHDSIRLGDKNDVEAIFNPDGSFNVNIVNAPGQVPENVVSSFNVSPAVPNGVETLVVGYTVPFGKNSKLQRIEFSGQNIGTFNVYKNGALMGQKHTWFNGPMHGEFSFLGTSEEGPELIAGDVIELKCIHARPFSGDFAGRIQSLEIG